MAGRIANSKRHRHIPYSTLGAMIGSLAAFKPCAHSAGQARDLGAFSQLEQAGSAAWAEYVAASALSQPGSALICSTAHTRATNKRRGGWRVRRRRRRQRRSWHTEPRRSHNACL